ncbi:hypothetical protein OGATHE_000650 [Ogataea polymorpha]|uniref:Uncharacterized protein n=1 Tax=Ogataea polymorpha TaxID=460523 RepID=A0A9P8PUR2_9ASCO|nr:hypothetical protein OGATHE_000650 [Ogataea polymorpha]
MKLSNRLSNRVIQELTNEENSGELIKLRGFSLSDCAKLVISIISDMLSSNFKKWSTLKSSFCLPWEDVCGRVTPDWLWCACENWNG